MKKFTGRRGLLLILMFCVALAPGCKKKEIQGPKGEPGTPGGGGNTGISTSEIVTIGTSQWLPNGDSSAWEYTLVSDLVTQEVMDKGVVKVYVKRGSSWTELPNTQGDLFTQFSFKTGSITLTFMDIHGGLPSRPATTDYRILTIYQSGKALNQDKTTFLNLTIQHD